MQTITRAKAKAQGLKTYYTGKACKQGHVAERRTDNKTCVCCGAKSASIWENKNKEKLKAQRQQYYVDNAEFLNAHNKQWRSENLELFRSYAKNWARNNPEKIIAKNAKRRSAKMQRTPVWLTKEQLTQIEEFYQIAQLFRTYTGQDYHVDHIVPLQGKTVSGLHTPWNLQILPAKENISKGNR